MELNIRRVNTFIELQNELFKDTYNSRIKRHRSSFVYRGLPDFNYELIHSLNRIVSERLDLEKSLIRNFKKYASADIQPGYGFWDILSLAQHHGLPTRLLDWTLSPFVALHFVTDDFTKYNTDGVVWCVDFMKAHSYIPKVLYNQLITHDSTLFTTEMLNDTITDYNGMLELETCERQNGNKDENFFLFFEPPSIDDRIINQYASFSVASRSNIKLDQWLIRHPELYKAVVIPSELKLEIRDNLDQINLNERVIYPGLDGLCKWLARHYTPTDKIYN